MKAMVTGDTAAPSTFYDRHSSLVNAICVRAIGDRVTADEVLVHVFYELWQRADRFDPTKSNPLTFLLVIARSRSIDRRRMASHRSVVRRTEADQFTHLPDRGKTPLALTITRKDIQTIRNALNTHD